MDFTNINDPAGVTALLEKLRSSQAWAELQSGTNEPPQEQAATDLQPFSSSNISSESNNTTAHSSGPSVATLLSQLSTEGRSTVDPTSHSSYSTSTTPATKAATQKKDARDYTFQQSLPYLAQLSEDPAFLCTISKLRKDQETLEKRLWDEREAIRERQQQKVKTAVTKANMLNIGISVREAENMKADFAKELEKFDREQVLSAWDDLITKQQSALEKLGVPTMFMTDSVTDRDKQQRIISVIEGITGSE